jgi:hypothetical protein
MMLGCFSTSAHSSVKYTSIAAYCTATTLPTLLLLLLLLAHCGDKCATIACSSVCSCSGVGCVEELAVVVLLSHSVGLPIASSISSRCFAAACVDHQHAGVQNKQHAYKRQCAIH